MQTGDSKLKLLLPVIGACAPLLLIVSIFLFTFVGGLYPNSPISQKRTTFALTFYATMSTLVSALAAFYFGSSSAKARQTQSKPAAPEISKLFPPNGGVGEALILTIMGKNDHPHAVLLFRRDSYATVLSIIETTLVCRITFPAASTHSGKTWSAIVAHPDGTSSVHSEKGVFTIS
jgi:hypothetical protein